MASKSLSMLLGKCVPSVKQSAAKICVTKMELDQNLLMYFKNISFVYAHDPERLCKTGDIVLIEELPKKVSKLISFRVVEVVQPLGDVRDPLTGKPVIGNQLREDIEEEKKLYGESPNAFTYEKAPPRGWQEGKKDFSDKPTYTKYHEIEGQDQPYGV